eukprot:CAMPEP_0179360074 /NCGR_PEP_ID=MMETSP0797-20121207/79782_1 /TAXON_ID=47934 /ORGANISM="Dinophysis acuminata, Strain DAEP01" /LENGTH=216 /DNA_ID=CAMNT_0021075403 /DNA_START=52 /DNA_END=699 /DNA_ORIENTATION=+
MAAALQRGMPVALSDAAQRGLHAAAQRGAAVEAQTARPLPAGVGRAPHADVRLAGGPGGEGVDRRLQQGWQALLPPPGVQQDAVGPPLDGRHHPARASARHEHEDAPGHALRGLRRRRRGHVLRDGRLHVARARLRGGQGDRCRAAGQLAPPGAPRAVRGPVFEGLPLPAADGPRLEEGRRGGDPERQGASRRGRSCPYAGGCDPSLGVVLSFYYR